MWLFLNNGFFSIVKPTSTDPVFRTVARDSGARASVLANYLLVRARRAGDIERVFPHSFTKPMRCVDRDYRYRALVSRNDVKLKMQEFVDKITYVNFKSSIRDRDYHDTCSRVWGVMDDYQRRHARAENYAGAPKLDLGGTGLNPWGGDGDDLGEDGDQSGTYSGSRRKGGSYESKRKQPRGR